MEIFKSFPHAELSQPQIIRNLQIVNDIFTGRNILVSNNQQHGKIQRLFRLQNSLSRRSSLPRKYSNTFSPADMSQPQIINNLKTFEDFFACRIVFAADHRCPENFQTLFHLQICLSRKSSTTWKNSKTFSPAEFSQTQTINNREIYKDFFACKSVLAANHHYPENIQRLFRLQNCLGRRSSILRKKSKTFPPAELSQPQIINNLTSKNSRFFRLQNCLGRKSSVSQNYSKTFSTAELSQPQIIATPKVFKDFLSCRIV